MTDPCFIQFEQSISFDMTDHKIDSFWIIKQKYDHKSSSRKEKFSDKLYQAGPKREFKKIFLDLIKSAKSEIYLCSFIISDKEIIQELIQESSKKTIIILTASEIRLMDDPDESDEFQTRVKREHQEFLEQSYRKILIRSSPNFHAKFLIVDPKSKDAKGLLFTGNFTTEAFERNFEIGMILDQIEVKNLFLQFMKGFYEIAERENLSERKFSSINKNFTKNIRDPQFIYSTIGNKLFLKQKILDMIKNSTGDLSISVYKLILESAIIQELIFQMESKNRKLILFTRHKDYNNPAIKKLSELGAEIFADDYLHAKFIYLPKEKEFLIFTANFSTEGIESGFESGLYYKNIKTNEIDNLVKEWMTLFPHSFHNLMSIRDLSKQSYKEIKSFKNNKLEEIKIKEEEKRKIGDISLTTINDSIPNMEVQKPDQEGNTIYKTVSYHRYINPPKLPNNSKKITDKEVLKDCKDFPLFERNNQYFVILEQKKKLKDAEKVAEKFNAIIIPQIKD